MKSTRVNRESGFTLIEIVMVLVLLGILAAVAAPKYFDLQKQAKIRAAQAAIAEAQAQMNGTFAKELLDGKDCTTARNTAEKLFADSGLTTGDWNIVATFANNTGDANADATERSAKPIIKYTGASATATDQEGYSDIEFTLYSPVCSGDKAQTES